MIVSLRVKKLKYFPLFATLTLKIKIIKLINLKLNDNINQIIGEIKT